MEPIDVDGQCNAHLYIADNYSDGHATMRCQEEKGHPGPHKEEFMREDEPVVITWHVDERKQYALDCDRCYGYGCLCCMPDI